MVISSATAFEMRFINFTGDSFPNVKITDANKRVLFEGSMQSQSYEVLKRVSRKRAPLTVSVTGELPGREVDLSIEDEGPLQIRVEKGDMWAMYRDASGVLQITEVNRNEAKKEVAKDHTKK